jgi:ribosomal protein L7/L12
MTVHRIPAVPVKFKQGKKAAAAALTTAQDKAVCDALRTECQALIAAGQRVDAVKKYRTATGCSLPEAKRQLGMK